MVAMFISSWGEKNINTLLTIRYHSYKIKRWSRAVYQRIYPVFEGLSTPKNT